MADANDRVQEALAAHLEHLELRGPAPDTSHLNDAELRELQELIAALDLTEGIAFGSGGTEAPDPTEVADTEIGRRLFSELRDALPPGVRIESDENALVVHVGGIPVIDRAVLGTFGGRVRVWLLDAESADAVEENASCVEDLGRVFRMFPDMAAVALVGRDLSCLIVQPEDCGPQIQVPSGSLVGRGFRRAIEPAVQALPDFIDELIPNWDPMPAFERGAGLQVDISQFGEAPARASVERQRAIGERARKGNPKKDALLALGEKEIAALEALSKGLLDGSIAPGDVEERIRRLVARR